MSQESNTISQINRRFACATCGDEFDGTSDVCPFDGTKLTLIAQELAPGSILGGRFEVVASVAGGGMGTVYKATHKLMKRSVAIKTLHPSLVASGAALKRFQQEAQALSALSHPNILSVFDFFISEEGQPYLVMDYLEGTNLDTIREADGPMPWQRAVGIFSQACAGLSHAHANGIIHRDIKPSNIMLITSDKKKDLVKIVDFGIAKVRAPEDQTTASLTNTGDVFGSPQYMSPEQCRGLPLDARSDVYSLCSVIYATLTGSPPFSGSDNMECMYKQVHTAVQPFAASLNCPEELEAIVRKGMAKEQDARWQSTEELQEALDKLLSDKIAAGKTAEMIMTPNMASAAAGDALGSRTGSGLQKVVSSGVRPESAGSASAALEAAGKDALAGSGQDNGAADGKQILLYIAGAAVLGLVTILSFGSLFHGTKSPLKQTIPAVASSQLQPGSPGQEQGTATSQPSGGAGSSGTGNAPSPSSAAASTTVPAGASISASAASPQTAPAVPAKTLVQVFEDNMSSGQKSFNEGDYAAAQVAFKAARKAAGSFGQFDDRYLQSMEWQAKVARKFGQFATAKQVEDYVNSVRKRLGIKPSKPAKVSKPARK